MNPEDFDLPDHWTENARGTFEGVVEENELTADQISSLSHAAELETIAERLDEVAREASYVATGSQGQEVVHPAVAEARQHRQAAAQILRGIGAGKASNPTSRRAQRAAMARWHGTGGSDAR